VKRIARICYTDDEIETIECKRVSYENPTVALIELKDDTLVIVPYCNVYRIEVRREEE
jgi:hypothetical protein